MRILHTADWHLGRVLHGASLLDDQAHLLAQFVDLARDVRPDVVVIAGDVYDRSVPPAPAVDLLDEVLSRLVQDVGLKVVVIAGNHDSPERLSFGARLLRSSGLILAGSPADGLAPLVLDDTDGPVHIYPLPFLEPAVVRHHLLQPDLLGIEAATAAMLDAIRTAHPKGERSVVVGHGFVSGGVESESERPLALGGSGCVDAAVFQGFDYVALGHLHRPQKVSEGVRYAGSLMRYSFSEADHDKAVSVVDLGAAGACEVRSVKLSPRRQVRVITGRLAEVLEGAAADPAAQDYLSVILQDEEPMFDAMGKLRAVYPNVLHIERPILQAASGAVGARVDHRKVSDLDLFAAFFQDVTGKALDDGQRGGLVGVLQRVENAAREVEA
jgi:exonuclease SbcD